MEHSGYNYDPRIETELEGKVRCAVEAAYAALMAEIHGGIFEWEDDNWGCHAYLDLMNGDDETKTCEVAKLWVKGRMVASISCIDDADKDYRDDIEADLALMWYTDYQDNLRSSIWV